MVLFHITSAAGAIPFALAAAIRCCDSEEDRTFMTSLYLSNSRQMFTYAFHFCGSREDAEDAVQDAFLSLVPKVSELRAMQADRVRAYLFTTLKHALWLAYRKKEKGEETERRAVLRDSPDADETPMFEYSFQDLAAALPHLSDKDQALLRMKYFLRIPDSEIAEQLHVKTGSVRTLTRRARQRLIVLMKEGRT